MKLVSFLMHWGALLVLERHVRGMSMDAIILELNQSAIEITEHINGCVDSPNNRRQLSHMVGIERWGQRRLRVALGEPFLDEEYGHYRPSIERSWLELTNDWSATRQATITLAGSLTQLSESPDINIVHNTYGALSIKGWLRYLDVHASSEGKRIK